MSEGNGKKRPIRVWVELDINEVNDHLLLIDDLYGTCGKCKQLGLNYLKYKSCPGCKTSFQYLAINSKNPEDARKILASIQKEKLSFQIIDKSDLERGSAHDAMGDLFQ